MLFGKVLYLVTGGKINPLIGSAGVSAVPMAAFVAPQQVERLNLAYAAQFERLVLPRLDFVAPPLFPDNGRPGRSQTG